MRRCVVFPVQEVLLEGPMDFHFARLKLFAAFKGNFAHLALSRFGCWSVEKMFTAVDTAKKVLDQWYFCIFAFLHLSFLCSGMCVDRAVLLPVERDVLMWIVVVDVHA